MFGVIGSTALIGTESIFCGKGSLFESYDAYDHTHPFHVGYVTSASGDERNTAKYETMFQPIKHSVPLIYKLHKNLITNFDISFTKTAVLSWKTALTRIQSNVCI